MILKVVDENNGTIGALQVVENDETGEVSVMDTYYVNAAVTGFDKIFFTNDEEITIQIGNALKRNLVADEIVADIVSLRAGQVYDDELLCEFTNDYFAAELDKIRELVDEKMQDYLEDDNLTVKR